jgi:hypothetical protein
VLGKAKGIVDLVSWYQVARVAKVGSGKWGRASGEAGREWIGALRRRKNWPILASVRTSKSAPLNSYL